MGEPLSTRVDEMVAGGVATKTMKGKPGSGQKRGRVILHLICLDMDIEVDTVICCYGIQLIQLIQLT